MAEFIANEFHQYHQKPSLNHENIIIPPAGFIYAGSTENEKEIFITLMEATK